jgi:hypothetical protein
MKIWNAIKNVDWRDVSSRALWTFLQAFLACFILAAEPIIEFLFAGSWRGVFPLAVSAIVASLSAGLSAVKTIVFEVVNEIKRKGI